MTLITSVRVMLLALVVLLFTSSASATGCALNEGDCGHTCKGANGVVQACCLVNGVYVDCNNVPITLLSAYTENGRKLLTQGPCANNQGDCGHTCQDADGVIQACCLINGVYVDCNNVPITALSAFTGNGRKMLTQGPCANNEGDCGHTCQNANGVIQACCLVNGVYVDCNNVPITLLSAFTGNGRKMLTQGPCANNEGDCGHTCQNANGVIQACCLVNGVYVDCNNVPITALSAFTENGRKLLTQGPCANNEGDCGHTCQNANGVIQACCLVNGVYVDCNNVPVTLLSAFTGNGRKLLTQGPCTDNEGDCGHTCQNANGLIQACCLVNGVYVNCNNIPVTLLSVFTNNGR